MVIFHRRGSVRRASSGSSSTELVNFVSSFPGMVAVHCLLALAPSYADTNPVARIRRSSDNALQDFTANQITDGTLLSWVGAGNHGFIHTLYDQSGNGRNATQTTTTLQRRVIISGTLQTKNGQPCWAGSSGEYEAFTYDSSSTNATFFSVAETAVGEAFWVALSATANATIMVVQQNSGGTDGKGLRVGANIKIYKNGSLQSITSRSDAYNSFPANTYFMLTATNVDMTDSLWNSTKAIYGYPSSTNVSMAGKVCFSCLYDSDVSADRESIESTLNAAFGVF